MKRQHLIRFAAGVGALVGLLCMTACRRESDALPFVESKADAAVSVGVDFLADGARQVLTTDGDVDGDGSSESLALWLTEEDAPFLTVDGTFALRLQARDADFYEDADMQAIDLDGDGRDEIAVFGGNLWGLMLQCAALGAGGWEELVLPDVSCDAAMLSGFCVRFTLSDGTAIEVDAKKTNLTEFFDADGLPYVEIARVFFPQDGTYEIVVRGGRELIAVTGYPALRALRSDGAAEYDFGTIPMYICIKDGTLQYEYGEFSLY